MLNSCISLNVHMPIVVFNLKYIFFNSIILSIPQYVLSYYVILNIFNHFLRLIVKVIKIPSIFQYFMSIVVIY